MEQAELADKAGVHVNTLLNIEKGKSEPRPETLEAIAAALGVTVTVIAERARAPRDLVREGGPIYGGSRATPFLDTLSRPGEVRRFDGHLGLGSRVAMALRMAEADDWGEDELIETLQRVQEWGEQADEELARLYRAERERERGDDPTGDP